MSSIDLMLDEENELTFQLSVEGTRPAEASARLILNNDNLSLVFEAEEFSNGEVSVVLPPLQHVLKEGRYDMDLEVIVDDRYFKPLTLEGNFEKGLVVKASTKTKTRKKRSQPSVTIVETPTSQEKPIVSVSNSKTRSKAAMLASSIRTPKKQKPVQDAPKNIQETKRVVKSSDISDEDILNIIKALTKQ